MSNATRLSAVLLLAVCMALSGSGLSAQDVKISDPTSVLLIVDRDSNELTFMDLESHKVVGSVFLGNNVNPHMAMITPDARYVVTGGDAPRILRQVDVKFHHRPNLVLQGLAHMSQSDP